MLEKLSGAKAQNSWVLRAMIIYLSPYAQATLHPMKSNSLKRPSVIGLPEANRKKIVSNLAYYSDPLDEQPKKQKIEMIALHKSNRKKQKLRMPAIAPIQKKVESGKVICLDSKLQKICYTLRILSGKFSWIHSHSMHHIIFKTFLRLFVMKKGIARIIL